MSMEKNVTATPLFQNAQNFRNRSDNSKVMTINAKGGMSTDTRFAYAILLAKMGQKIPKNSHLGPKNAQNDLKFGQTL